MEKNQEHKQKQSPRTVWDCGSSLYDSFELKSFERQLDSAISSRTLSMPHLVHLPPPPGPQPRPISKKPSKFSRSFHKLLKSVFGPKQNATGSLFNTSNNFKGSQDVGYYVVCGSSSADSLYTILEAAAEHGGVSPDFEKSSSLSLVKRAASERFSASSVGISCA